MAKNSYFGQYYVKVDPKGRIAVPATYREGLGDEFHISLSLDHCLNMVDSACFEATSRHISTMPTNMSSILARRFNAFSFVVKPDKQGRVVIPPMLRTELEISLGDELVIAGMGSHLDVWHKEEWYDAVKIPDDELDTYKSFMKYDVPEDAEETNIALSTAKPENGEKNV